MKTPVKRRRAESGQAILLVILAMGTFLLGAVGLAVDGAHLYAQRQMAQAAADAAAQAGIMSIFDGSNISGSTHYFDPATGVHNCGTGDAGTPCFYAQTLNGFNGTDDTVTYEPNPGVSVPGLSSDPVNLLRVTVQRSVPTTLIRMLGPTASTIKATGTAAILTVMAPVPILVLHPTLGAAFSKNGTNDVVICGGPTRSIQVNSDGTLPPQGNATAPAISISGNSGTINLNNAGPLDSGNCDSGTGADIDSHGGPSTTSPPSGLLLGTKPGHYIDPASPLKDPLLGMPAPPIHTTVGHYTVYPPGQHGCPSTLPTTGSVECRVYSPGLYDGSTAATTLNLTQVFAIFQPGIYTITHKGFTLGNNTIVRMAQSPDNFDPTPAGDPAATTWTQGMLVYNSPTTPVNQNNDVISIAANAGQISNVKYPTTDCPAGGNCLVGANGGALTSDLCSSDTALNSSYYGVLFFQNRSTATTLNHSLQGGGGLSIKGTIYLTHTAVSTASDGTYQSLNLQGTSGSTTKVQGEIITDVLSLGGTSQIVMNLSGLACYHVRQVALVQ